MNSTEMLRLLVRNAGSYIFDDIGAGEIVLRDVGGADMKILDEDGREISPRFPHELIQGLMLQGYIAQDQNNGRIYRVSNDGRRAAQS